MRQALSILLLLISAAGFSQINFEPGYYIDNSGTRTEGFIRNIAWKDTPLDFEFRSSTDGETKVIKMEEAREFNVDAYKFRRFNVKIERSSYLTNKMDTTRDIKWNDETIYLKLLVEGSASLYQYEDNNLIKYFYSTGDHTAAEQLLYKEFIDNTKIRQINQYKQQLHNLMKDEVSTNKFERLKYRKEPLVEVFNLYNTGKGGHATDYTENQNKGEVHFKITPGIGFTSLEISNDIIKGSEFKFDNKTTFRIGLEIEYIMPFNNNKWSLFVDPNYQTYKETLENDDYTIAVDYKRIELPIGARHYFFLTDRSKIFIDAAYVFDFQLSGSQIQFNQLKPFEISKTSHYAFGAGLSVDKFSLEARYNIPHGILRNYVSWFTDYSSLNLIFGYRFL